MPDEPVDCQRNIRPHNVFGINKSCYRADECVTAHKGHQSDAGFIFKERQEHTEIHRHRAELEREEWGEKIAKACANCTVIGFTGEKWRRFAAKGSDKGHALQILADVMQIPLCDVIAFGDDRNDLDMLKLAGTSVAVSNAIDEVRAEADQVTKSNDEDGVALYLDRHLLIEA